MIRNLKLAAFWLSVVNAIWAIVLNGNIHSFIGWSMACAGYAQILWNYEMIKERQNGNQHQNQ